MRDYEAGQPRTAWPYHPWFKRLSNAAAHVSAATLLATSVANGLAARRHKGGSDHRGRRDESNSNEHGGNDRNRGDKPGNGPNEDRGHRREQKDRSNEEDSGSGNRDRSVKQERQNEAAGDDSIVVAEKQKSNQGSGSTAGGNDTTTVSSGKGDGGGIDAGNAGSGLFDSPLATKARRRANDFGNADPDLVDDGTFVDVDPDGESVYETDSVSLITGPDGLEILTNNITYFAEPTPTPEPLPRLELPLREPGFPFGEDFPFGNWTTVIAPKGREPSDPGDTGTAIVPRAMPIPSQNQPEPSSDGGDNTMDFLS